jgi:pyruvate kinase
MLCFSLLLLQYAREGVEPPISLSESIASSTVKTAWDIEAKLILGLTESGRTAHLISKYRPNCPVLCVSTSDQVARQSLLFRSVYPFVLGQAEHNALKIEHAIEYAKHHAFVAPGDLVVVTSGVISGNSGGTNSMSIETVPK